MTLYINIKQHGKRKNTVEKVPFDYPCNPKNLRELLVETVKLCAASYTGRMEQQGSKVLEKEEMNDMAAVGKIAFGVVYGGKKPDEEMSVFAAIQEFEDGLFRIFLGDMELEELEAPIHLKEGDTLTFVRLTMLAGRIW